MYFLQDSLFLSVVSLSGQRHDIMAFYLLSCHACCKWHWPIRKHLDLWIHLRSLPCAFSRRSVNQPIVWFLNAATTPCWRDPNTSKQLSTTVAILGFQFWLYHVVVTLSFLRSNQLCFIVMLTIIPFSGLLMAKSTQKIGNEIKWTYFNKWSRYQKQREIQKFTAELFLFNHGFIRKYRSLTTRN